MRCVQNSISYRTCIFLASLIHCRLFSLVLIGFVNQRYLNILIIALAHISDYNKNLNSLDRRAVQPDREKMLAVLFSITFLPTRCT